jgi:hypothetical protein
MVLKLIDLSADSVIKSTGIRECRLMENEFNDRVQKDQSALSREANIDKNVERVYRKYGSDLASFFRDVQEELAMKKCSDQNRIDTFTWKWADHEGNG